MASNSSNKKQKTHLSVENKLNVVRDVEAGLLTTSEVAAKWDISCATVNRIVHEKDNLQQYADLVPSMSATTSNVMNPAIRRMELLLVAWIEDMNSKGLPIDGKMIQQKALLLYKRLENLADEGECDFNASRGWLHRFQKRTGVRNVNVHGEKASADYEAAEKFRPVVKQTIEEGGYSLHQVYDCDETRVFYKKMPQKSYVVKEIKQMPGRKADKKAFTLLFCSNASGSHFTKPLLINDTANPRALKNVNRNNMPVFYNSNSKGWMTAQIFSDWLNNSFAPEAEEKCKELNLSFKILLLLDNAACHPHTLEHPNIKLLFLPPNTTSILQPLDQGIIANFKLYYIKLSYTEILKYIDSADVDLIEAWKKFSIKDSISCIGEAVKRVKPSTLSNCWKPLLDPESNKAGVEQPDASVMQEILEMGAKLGAPDLNHRDVAEILEEEELSVDELMEQAAEGKLDEEQLFCPKEEEFAEHLENLDRLLKFVTLDINSTRGARMQELFSEGISWLEEWKAGN